MYYRAFSYSEGSQPAIVKSDSVGAERSREVSVSTDVNTPAFLSPFRF